MTTFLSIADVEVTTEVNDGYADPTVGADRVSEVTITSSRDPRFISFPRDLHEKSDETNTASNYNLIPYIKLSVYEIKRDASTGLSAVGDGASDLTGATAGSINTGISGVYETITNTPGFSALVTGALAAQLGAGALTTAGAAVIGGSAEALGADVLGSLDTATSKLLGVEGKTIGDRFKERLNGFGVRRNVEDIKTHIILPMPENIGVVYDQQYLEVGLTQALGIPGMLAQSYAASNNKSQFGAGGADPYAMELAASVARNIPGLDANADRVLFFGTTGLVVNPQLEVLFTGTAPRKFILDFKLTPKNREDALALFSGFDGATKKPNGVISALKYYSAPEIPDRTSGRYFIPPAQFVIEFFKGGTIANEALFKTKKCVLTSVSVDYTPNGYATHKDGTPAQVNMQLNFVETSILSRADFTDNGIR